MISNALPMTDLAHKTAESCEIMQFKTTIFFITCSFLRSFYGFHRSFGIVFVVIIHLLFVTFVLSYVNSPFSDIQYERGTIVNVTYSCTGGKNKILTNRNIILNLTKYNVAIADPY